MRCLACGFLDDYEPFIAFVDDMGAVVGMRCPECGNEDIDEIDEFEDDEDAYT